MLVETFVRSGFARVMLQNGWRPMAGGSFITYRRGLQPLQEYRLRCRFTAGDTRWNYLHFEFLRGDVVCAAGYVKGAVAGRDGWVSNHTSHTALGLPPPGGDLPAAVRHWRAAEHDVLAHAGQAARSTATWSVMSHIAGAAILGTLGALHLVFTGFTQRCDPRDAALVPAMQTTSPRLAWLAPAGAAAYTALAGRYGFRVPLTGAALAMACFCAGAARLAA